MGRAIYQNRRYEQPNTDGIKERDQHRCVAFMVLKASTDHVTGGRIRNMQQYEPPGYVTKLRCRHLPYHIAPLHANHVVETLFIDVRET